MKAPCDWHDVYLDKLGSQQESEFMPGGSNKEILIKGLLAEVWAAWGSKQGIVSPKRKWQQLEGTKGEGRACWELAPGCTMAIAYGHWVLGGGGAGLTCPSLKLVPFWNPKLKPTTLCLQSFIFLSLTQLPQLLLIFGHSFIPACSVVPSSLCSLLGTDSQPWTTSVLYLL